MKFSLLLFSFFTFSFLQTSALVTLTPKQSEIQCVTFTKTLQVGSSTDPVVRKEVKLLQTFLGVNNYLNGIPTGTFGKTTAEALKSYQKKENLPITGVLDKNTKESIAKKNCGDDIKPKLATSATTSSVGISSRSNDDTTTTFSWSFHGKNYELAMPLSNTLYSYYRQSPKVYTYHGKLPDNWTEDYNQMFLKVKNDDTTFDTLSLALLKLARKDNLSSDDTANFILSFVQSIPYDFSKDLKRDQTQYPYETLFTKKGVCADKTFLAYHLLKKAGYGVAIMQFLEKNHQAVGIKCTREDAVFNSGYCYAETTTFLPIGMVPTSFGENGQGGSNLSETNPEFDLLLDTTRLGLADVFLKTDGKSFFGVSDLKKKLARLEFLSKEIMANKDVIASSTEDLEARKKLFLGLKVSVDKAVNDKDYEAYTKLRDDYNSKVLEYQSAYKIYQDTATLYNKDVKEYNQLLFVLDQTK